MTGTTYLAGPMRKIASFNFPAFHDAAAKLRAQGHFVLNPAEHDEQDLGLNPLLFPNGEFSDAGWSNERIAHFMRQAFAWDMAAICRANTIALLPGWEKSEGVAVELGAARLLNLEIIRL